MKKKSLQRGDLIGIAAAASPFHKEAFLAGVEYLKKEGYEVYYRDDIFDKKDYLAGSDARRCQELIELLENPKIKAILFARGGYGSMRLLPYLDSYFKKRPKIQSKIIIGYSDLTSLLLYFLQNKKMSPYYGPVVAKDLGESTDPVTKSFLIKALSDVKPLGELKFNEVTTLKPGKATGELTGGCLSLVVASLGTPYEINTKGKILFLEDIHEKPYAVDRMLTQLTLAKKLKTLKGVIFGSLVYDGPESAMKEAILHGLQGFKGPVLYGFPAGHGKCKITFPLGVKVRIDSAKKTVDFLE